MADEPGLEPVLPDRKARPAPLPRIPDPVVPVQEPTAPRVALVLSGSSIVFERVAAEIHSLVEQPLVYNLADTSPQETFRRIADSDTEVVVAVGLRATVAAAELSAVPVVYCQVFNFEAPHDAPVPVKGVASIPPLSLQLRAWKQLQPGLKSVGTIIGEGHERLLDEAQLAAAEHGIALDYRIARSDRETLYLFKRLAPTIDGFWLFPDNRILSVFVLQEVLDSAPRHHVQVAVFSPALLELGAELSSSSVDADIASTVLSVVEQLVTGDGDSIPALTPLRKIEVRTRARAGDGTAAARPVVGAGAGAAKGTR